MSGFSLQKEFLKIDNSNTKKETLFLCLPSFLMLKQMAETKYVKIL